MSRIAEVTRECFDAVIQVRRVEPAGLPQPEALQRQLRAFVDRLFTRAAQAGFARDDVDDIAFAVAALADEIVASRSEALGEFWAGHSLQQQYFRVTDAGEAFFTRLERIRKDPRRREVLQVYALALLLGFQGRYRVRGKDLELLTIVDELQRELGRAGRDAGEVLSPRGERPEDGRAAAGKAGPAVWIALGALALVLALYAGLHLSLGLSTDSVVQRVSAAVAT